MLGLNKFMFLHIATAALLLVVLAGTLRSQETAGAISGTVTDSTGAAIPGATVTVTNQDTRVSSTITTNGKGFYSAEALTSGSYAVAISKAGFEESVTQEIHLD